MTQRETMQTTACTDDWLPTLEPSIRSIVTAAVPACSRSLPVAVCSAASAVGIDTTDEPDSARTVPDCVPTAVSFLEGYLRLRHQLVAPDQDGAAAERDVTAADRDPMILASDLCHARAYAVIGDAAIPPERTLVLYRVLSSGSETIARRLSETVDSGAQRAGVSNHQFGSMAELSATAATLGATAVGSPAATRTAMQRYGRSLTAAIESQSDTDQQPLRSTVVRVLPEPGPPRSQQTGAPTTLGDTGSSDTPIDRGPITEQSPSNMVSITEHVDRARAALDTLAATEPKGSVNDDSSPVASLDRALRIILNARGTI